MDFTSAVKAWALGLGSTGLKMLLILVGVFVVLEFTRHYGLLEKALRGLSRATRFIGLDEKAGLPWLAGNVFGIIFGAGVITEEVRRHELAPRQVVLVSTFLALCHGLFEDTALFVVVGANLFWIFIPRIVLGVTVTWVLSKIMK